MKQILETLLSNTLLELKKLDLLPDSVPLVPIKIDRIKNVAQGDFSTNIAMILAKPIGLPPRELATLLVNALPSHEYIERIEIAGPGFINFFIHKAAQFQIIPQVLSEKTQFGANDFGKGMPIIIEFVSANPTGPLHVGHGRSAAFGASLANLLAASGFKVTREYYVNDAGRQMDILAVSVWLRYLELCQEAIVFPCNAYKGDYVFDIADVIQKTDSDIYHVKWPLIAEGLPLDEIDGGDKEEYIDALIYKAKTLLGIEKYKHIHQQALNAVLSDIKNDLAEFSVHYDSWFSEQTLMEEHALQDCLDALTSRGCTYEKEGALWFKASDYGDEKDWVLVRANGQATYFASDIAYHWNKYARGFKRLIDIFGADHHGYVQRIKAAMRALEHNEQDLTILLVQFAILYRQGNRVQMSTRSGSFVTLRELREEVGNDAARFFYVMRKPEQHMDFDLDLAKSESNDNPVYYIQYAHARICSVLKQLKEKNLMIQQELSSIDYLLLDTPEELHLVTLLCRYPEMIQTAAESCEPHQIAYYLRELATGLHSYYNAVRLICEDVKLRSLRIKLLQAVKQVLWNGLQLLGVTAPESM